MAPGDMSRTIGFTDPSPVLVQQLRWQSASIGRAATGRQLTKTRRALPEDALRTVPARSCPIRRLSTAFAWGRYLPGLGSFERPIPAARD